ncbi:diguanylate cyclase [[Leptolyngbya] sp. PCC 7376]|uniref:diguanylate cyclase domain-containing protein n=1 Tax=[Leptolyngbya] sp. PCC 7376 TaxID=111781 RepID=UPI00029ED451|nr:diguanylate cyclase [[Leptolyngbya] sp. PCC 7376]AFY39396.1 diguanylate cyclase [[Leptolyngbya] sp. PCC 7376]
MKDKEQTMIQAFIDSFDWGVLISLDSQGQMLMNNSFVEIFRIPDEVRYGMSYESQISYIGSLMRDEGTFIHEVHITETQPLIETQELLHTIDGRSFELISKPVRLDQLVLGRIWNFQCFAAPQFDHQGVAFVAKRRQELLAMLVSQTIQKRSPKEILRNVVNQLGQVFAVERAIVYQLDGKAPEGMRFEWSVNSHIGNFKDYYLYFQNNPWVWSFYSQVQCNHVGAVTEDPARKIRALLHELDVKTCLSFPIIVEDHLWGVLLLHSCYQQKEWLAEEIEFLEVLTNQLAIAIHQYELEQQLATSQQQIAATNTTDELTLIPNARRFEQVLEKEWQRLAREDLPLTVLCCKIDHFDLYHDTYGEELARQCLQQVSWAIALVCQRPADLVARCSAEEFGVILPNTDLDGALFLADQILSSIPKLGIDHLQSPIDKHVTVSIGINSIVPTLAILPSDLMTSTQQALEEAIATGGNRISLGEMLSVADR